MLDIWIGDINIAPILWIFTFFVIFPIQLTFCFKVKSKIVRSLPVIILSILTAATIIAALVGTGWDVIFYLVSAVYFAIMLFVCGIAWGIWFIIKMTRQRRN